MALATMVSSVPTPTADSLNNAHTQSAGNMSQVNEQTARIIAHSKHFNALINQIPAKYYLLSSQDDGSKSGGWVKYGVNINKRKAPKDEVKENTKRAKKLRLDPASHKSTVDTQIEVIEQRKQDLIAAAAGSDSDSDREDPNETNTETAPAVVERRVTLNANPAQNIDDLKKRLAARLAGFQSKRKYDDEKSDAHNKAKAKEIREQRKKKKSEDQKKGITAPSADRPSRVHMTTGGEETGEGKSSQQIVYSKFDFSALEKEKKKKAKKSNDLKMLLEKAESEKKAMEDLKQADPAKAKDIEEKRRQKKALEMAQGIKQQDDPTLLRKALKKKEQKKLKSAKTWNDSIKAVKHNIKRNEAKRDANLKARVDAKKEKKIARGQGKKVKSKKPPPKRAGFEGKSKNPTKSGKSKK